MATRYVSGMKDYYKSIVLGIIKNGGTIRHRQLYRLINPNTQLTKQHNIPTSHYAKYINRGIIVKVGPGTYAVNPVLLASGCKMVTDVQYDILSDSNKLKYYECIQKGLTHDEAMTEVKKYLARKERARIRRKLKPKPKNKVFTPEDKAKLVEEIMQLKEGTSLANVFFNEGLRKRMDDKKRRKR